MRGTLLIAHIVAGIVVGSAFVWSWYDYTYGIDKLPNNAANVARNVERAKARVAAVKKDRKAIAAKAVERMRRAAHEDFGAKAAADAEITAHEADVTVVNDESWTVTGRYSGRDQHGKEFVAPFNVSLQIIFYSLYASDIQLSERTYK